MKVLTCLVFSFLLLIGTSYNADAHIVIGKKIGASSNGSGSKVICLGGDGICYNSNEILNPTGNEWLIESSLIKMVKAVDHIEYTFEKIVLLEDGQKVRRLDVVRHYLK